MQAQKFSAMQNNGLKTPQRTVTAGAVKILAAEDASVLQFGDGENTRLKSAAIAVQRAIPTYHKDETRFASYPLFFLPLPRPTEPPGGMLIRARPEAAIRLGFIEVTSIRAASLFRFGNTGKLETTSRILHIRHFNNIRLPPPAGTSAENQ